MSSVVASLGHPQGTQRSGIGWWLVVVVAAHALAAATLSPRAATPEHSTRAVQVRVVHPAPTASPTGTSPSTVGVDSDRQVRGQATQPPTTVPRTLTNAAASAEVIYQPRGALTVAPRALASVTIDYPYFDGEGDHYTGEFDLFIDEAGGVVRVVGATPGLPGILAQAVKQAFLGARFSPGEIDGRPVRSRIRIEVTFDSPRAASS